MTFHLSTFISKEQDNEINKIYLCHVDYTKVDGATLW